jgi:hypothetical protein
MTASISPGSGEKSNDTHGFEHFTVESDGLCWWCRERPANTGEHKYKRTDLTRLMKDDSLVWVGDTGTHELRGSSGIRRDRYGVVKFPKSMCAQCNNVRSQPFDLAYDRFATFLASGRAHRRSAIPLARIFGRSWREDNRALARYYGKHFGCRLHLAKMPIPDSLRSFLDGAGEMPDVHMALISTDTVRRFARNGLALSPDFVMTDPKREQLQGLVMATYVAAVGVRFQWWTPAAQPPGELSQFFDFANPILNHFADEEAMGSARKRPPLPKRALGWPRHAKPPAKL